MARPTKLTPALHQSIVQAVQSGVPYVQAAVLFGVSVATAMEWRRRGDGTDDRKATPLYATFAQDLQKAMAADEAVRLARITQAARGGVVVYERTMTYPDGRIEREVKYTRPEWTADAWVLERSHPERWGRRDRLDMHLQIQKAAALVGDELGLDPAEILAEAQQLLRRMDHDA